MRLKTALAALAAATGVASPPAFADINIGVTLSLTGPGASLGIPTKNTIQLFPGQIGGQKINYIVLDDGSDGTNSVRNFQRLVEENKVDAVMGSSTTPATIPLTNLAAERKIPHISLAASAKIVEPQDASRKWTFKAIPNESLVVGATVDHMLANKVKNVAFIGFSDAYGETFLSELKAQEKRGIAIPAAERYSRTDTTVQAQILKIISSKPDAVFIAGAGTPGALPHKTLRERGYKGRIYHTYGIANRDFLRLAGKDAEGAVFASGPVLVASQLNPANPIKAVAEDFIKRYDDAYGAGSTNIFSANAWDANMMLRAGLDAALAKEKPGTEAFRVALRDGMEHIRNLVTTQGVMNMSASDHVGYDKRAAVMIEIENSSWKYLKDADK